MAASIMKTCPSCSTQWFFQPGVPGGNIACACGTIITDPFATKLPGLIASPLQPTTNTAPSHMPGGGNEPPAAPVYQKILTHAGREYRIGTCTECDKENVILSGFVGRIVSVSNMCLSCLSMAEKEIAQASSQLHAAKAGGTYGEKKLETWPEISWASVTGRHPAGTP
jgi:hypothetical protein